MSHISSLSPKQSICDYLNHEYFESDSGSSYFYYDYITLYLWSYEVWREMVKWIKKCISTIRLSILIIIGVDIVGFCIINYEGKVFNWNDQINLIFFVNWFLCSI